MSSRYSGFFTCRLLLVSLAASLAACSGAQPSSSSLGGVVPQAESVKASLQKSVKGGVLYLSGLQNGTISLYNIPSYGMTGSIAANSIGVYVSPSGDVYSVNRGPDSVTVYNKDHQLLRTLTRSISEPDSVAFDGNGNVYVKTKLKILTFVGGKQTKVQGIKVRAIAMAVDAQGNRYVVPMAGENEIDIYPPGATAPTRKIASVKNVDNLTVDQMGNLYASEYQASAVTEYSTSTYGLENTITQGISFPGFILVGTDGNLYVSNLGGGPEGSVSVYPLGQTAPSRVITAGIVEPKVLALDGASNLYVENTENATVYASGSTSVLSTITPPNDDITGLAVGP